MRRRRHRDAGTTPWPPSLAPARNGAVRTRRALRRHAHATPQEWPTHRLRRRGGRTRSGGHHAAGSRSARACATSRSLALHCRRRSRQRLRRRRGRSRRRRRRNWSCGGLLPRRQKCQRVDVSLGIVRAPDAEMHIGHIELRVSRRPDHAHRLAFCHSVARVDRERAQVEQRDREPVFGPDRDGSAVAREPAGEGDLPRRGSPHHRARDAPDVDPGVPALVVFGAAEVERPQDGALSRPGPGGSGCRPQEEGDQHREGRCLLRQHRCERSRPSRLLSNPATETRGRACCVGRPSAGRRHRPRNVVKRRR